MYTYVDAFMYVYSYFAGTGFHFSQHFAGRNGAEFHLPQGVAEV